MLLLAVWRRKKTGGDDDGLVRRMMKIMVMVMTMILWRMMMVVMMFLCRKNDHDDNDGDSLATCGQHDDNDQDDHNHENDDDDPLAHRGEQDDNDKNAMVHDDACGDRFTGSASMRMSSMRDMLLGRPSMERERDHDENHARRQSLPGNPTYVSAPKKLILSVTVLACSARRMRGKSHYSCAHQPPD